MQVSWLASLSLKLRNELPCQATGIPTCTSMHKLVRGVCNMPMLHVGADCVGHAREPWPQPHKAANRKLIPCTDRMQINLEAHLMIDSRQRGFDLHQVHRIKLLSADQP